MHDPQFDPPALLTPEQAVLALCLLLGSVLILLTSNSVDTSRMQTMFLDGLFRYLPWNPLKGEDSYREKKHSRKRAERLELRTSAGGNTRSGTGTTLKISNIIGSSISGGYYPGLVNISGTYCFLNSTLQVSQR
jgi:ubiquitin carboxyl-terminal hydrolase 1